MSQYTINDTPLYVTSGYKSVTMGVANGYEPHKYTYLMMHQLDELGIM